MEAFRRVDVAVRMAIVVDFIVHQAVAAVAVVKFHSVPCVDLKAAACRVDNMP